MKIAYLECPTGIAGDMCLGALVHAGVPLTYLIEKLEQLGIDSEYKLWAELVFRNGQQATKVHVDLAGSDHSDPQFTFAQSHQHDEHQHEPQEKDTRHPLKPHHVPGEYQQEHRHEHRHEHKHEHEHPSLIRHLPEIEQLIQAARLPHRAETWSLEVFRRLAIAEGAVHGISANQVHFHEVGATDAIVDIVGTCLGLDWLGIDQLHCSALPMGGGTIRAAHGRLPVPAPAVLKLWEMRQIPIYSNGINREMVTPTGAAIATTLATHFGAPPPMTLQQVGLGAGSIDLEIPNILRLWIGETEERKAPQAQSSKQQPFTLAKPQEPQEPQESVMVLETQLDDVNPQVIGYVFEALLAAGALDVFTQAIGMKKSRPGILLSVICRPQQVAACEAIVFQETTTLGIRRTPQQRSVLEREIQTVAIDQGIIRVKVARQATAGKTLNVQPEYEDCAQIARQTQTPWQEIHRLALEAWYQLPRTP
ncbi:MAG: nickel pincer cofactor biosynthesis protein LarC [Leptolyngbyaceae cyanobacterium CSU_1_4]|nr:nickel pincer cofactor biosynthesis protein LarC [Leptolyngbyaceae cyanobacterium CSU_1_4]